MGKLWKIAHGRSIELEKKSILMGILNVTPDSFSDGGSYTTLENAINAARKMVAAGADIIDIGGESTRPGSAEISVAEEQARILPVVRCLSEAGYILSIDTYHKQTAHAALKEGAHIINDVWGLQKEPEIAEVAAEYGAGVVVMHTGRGRERLADVIADQALFFEKSLKIAQKAGVENSALMLDPGFGFAKDVEENVALIARADALNDFGFPWLVGTSRKRFLGTLTGKTEPVDRDVATAATSVMLRQAGASVFRVHNVPMNKDALLVADAVYESKNVNEKSMA